LNVLKDEIAASIILYHPDREDLRRNISAIAPYIGTLILWRNSSEDISLAEDLPCGVVFMGDGSNRYISEPLNECLKYCSGKGIKWLLTMDQDSEFEDFASILASAQNAIDCGWNDAIVFAPDINNGRYSSFDAPIEIESTITSGSLCSVEKSISVGGFRESYKIYWVDSEFCHRARLSGFKIVALPGNNLRQKFGKIKKVHGIECFNYSPSTLYFLFRNMLWMHREYKVNPDLKCMLYSTKMYLGGILVGENDKLRKMKSVAKGIAHGLLKSYK